MTQLLTKETRYAADFAALEEKAKGDPQWLQDLRRKAYDRFSSIGFPTARRGNEEWKYTSVGPIAEQRYHVALNGATPEISLAKIKRAIPWDEAWPRLVFINGRYVPEFSKPHTHGGELVVRNLAEAVRDDGAVMEHLARHADFESNAFTALNTAFLQDGAYVKVAEDATARDPVHIVYMATGECDQSLSRPRTLLVAGSHAKATVIETYVNLGKGRYFTNAVTEASIGDGAQIDRYLLLMEGAEAFHVGSAHVQAGRDSSFTSTAVSLGAAIARSNTSVVLNAPGASATVNGLYVTSGAQHLDMHTSLFHAAPQTTSRQQHKGILDGQSRSVFAGRVVIPAGSQKADARLVNKNLLLSRGAEVDTKPSMEIFADDVKATHGATAGQLDQTTLFYLNSRGIDADSARRLLVHGFASEILNGVQIAKLRAFLDRLFLKSLPLDGSKGAA